MKVLIIVFFIVFAIIDLIMVCGPALQKYINKKKEEKARRKRHKAFKKKMKDLEIK